MYCRFALGLSGVVGGIGQIYIFSIFELAMIEDAKAQARAHPAPHPATQLAFPIAIGCIGIGLVVTYVGFRIRKVEGNKEVRPQRALETRRRREGGAVPPFNRSEASDRESWCSGQKASSQVTPLATGNSPGRQNNQIDCPACGAGMAPEAVLCLECGFNRQTGKRLRTAVRPPTRHFYPEGGYVIRVVICLLALAPLSALAVFATMHGRTTEAFGVKTCAAALALAGSTLRRLTVTKDSGGRPMLVTRRYTCFFVPGPPARRDLRCFSTIRLGFAKGVVPTQGLLMGLLVLGVFVVFGRRETFPLVLIAGILYYGLFKITRRETFTLEIGGSIEGEPVLLYRSPNERLVKELANALERRVCFDLFGCGFAALG